jgi:hypothetical protein
MKTAIGIWSLVAAVVVAEVAAALWMRPPELSDSILIPEIVLPMGDEFWQSRNDLVSEVMTPLRCSAGRIGDYDDGSGLVTRLSYFRWDSAETVNTLEAFKHLPEQCMGAVGMRLEKVYPARVISGDCGQLIFDSTLFRPESRGTAIHIFKCVWVSGFESSNLREDVLMGNSGLNLRQLRLAAAMSRFRPPHARVIMGGVSGMPTEELAWAHFQSLIEPRLQWISPDQIR